MALEHDPTPAEKLREAARLMRYRADLPYVKGAWEVAEEGTWVRKVSASRRMAHPGHAQAGVCLRDPVDEKVTSEAVAEHIASWDPLVALAVAAWLDDAALMASEDNGQPWTHPLALAVARAYLGES